MSLEVLQILAYLVIGTSVTAYIMLDGFDLGVGILQLFARKDEDRRIFLNAIGPVWDGNEVWLVVIAGGLFSAFSAVYAAIFSGFYDLFMIVLAGLIFRAVAIEFRSKMESYFWRNMWDILFSMASIAITFFVGLAIGNLILGVPINAKGVYQGNFGMLFTPFAVFVGVFALSIFAQHGLLYLLMKTEDPLQSYLRRLYPYFYGLYFTLYITVSIWTWFRAPHMLYTMNAYKLFYLVPIATILSFIGLGIIFCTARYGWAFLTSCFSIATLFITYGIGTFPNMLYSSIDPKYSMTLYNSSSTYKTLTVFMIIVVIGVPIVLAYTAVIYHLFRGKVKLHGSSY
ncbi:MAG: Cytochrome bd-I ubiquinol oxidase subunit 2 [Chlamydiia bacterium]|nr:Cytochrome bd-I ubiquinol oxidase subunit 2 [Chlamydiia bacterium]